MHSGAISVVVRTFNSARTLDAVLSGLAKGIDDEFIVVDSGSTDATLAIAERHGAQRVLAPGAFNYSKSLNLGFSAARNPWVLVISSHSVPLVADFLNVYRQECADLPAEVVVGYGPSTLSGKSDLRADSIERSIYGKEQYGQVSQVCGNGNAIYRREAWVELPFDENIRTSEDKLWLLEMLRRGYCFAYIPAMRMQNRNQASLAYMFRKGFSDARTLRRVDHRPMNPRQLAGALKNIGLQKVRGEIDTGNWLRYSAHTFGQFFASYRSEDNSLR